jgi:hypothetical protein
MLQVVIIIIIIIIINREQFKVQILFTSNMAITVAMFIIVKNNIPYRNCKYRYDLASCQTPWSNCSWVIATKRRAKTGVHAVIILDSYIRIYYRLKCNVYYPFHIHLSSDRLLYNGYDRDGSFALPPQKTGHWPQDAWRQEDLIGDKPPVAKYS